MSKGNKQYEGDKVSSGVEKKAVLRKAKVTPSPSDKGSSQNGKG